MVVSPQAEVVGHPLAHALRIVVFHVRSNSADGGDQHETDRSHTGNLHLAGAACHVLHNTVKPSRQMVASHHIVEHDLERPGTGQAHYRLNQHREKYDAENPTVRGDEITNKANHGVTANPGFRWCDSGAENHRRNLKN
jgi:hypothetical protein